MISLSNRIMAVERRTLISWLAMAVILMPFTFAAMQTVGLDDIMKLLADGAWLCIAAMPLLRGKMSVRRSLIPLALVAGFFFLETLIVYLFRYQSIFYYFWGVRNCFRFYIVFFAVASCFREKDGAMCLKLFDSLFWVNAFVCLVQFLLGFRQDYLGGIFGVSKGCNGYMIVYLSIVISKTVLSYMNGTVGFASCFFKCAAALIISAVSELRFFFFLFIFILGMAMLLTRFSFRKVFLLGVGAILVAVTSIYLGTLYSGFKGFLSIDTLIDALTRSNYASENDMGRFSAIAQISDRFLTDVPSRLFGMGIGNCDTSSIAVFNTPFYETYRDTHYSIFTNAFLFMENGYVGLAFYVLFFVICLFFAVKRFRENGANQLFCQMAIIIALICFSLLFYNASLRIEAGYMIYFVLALPFVNSDIPQKQQASLPDDIHS